MTEQSVMLSSYPSGEILFTRRKLHTAVTVGVSPVTNSRLTVKKETRDESNFGPIFNPQ